MKGISTLVLGLTTALSTEVSWSIARHAAKMAEIEAANDPKEISPSGPRTHAR